MKYPNISSSEAKEIIIERQLLNGKHKPGAGRKGTADIINKLGYIQIDTISVINRSHHHTLWTRNGKYSETHLHDLQTKDKAIYEYWGHAMSYLPMEDYRYSIQRMENFNVPGSQWVKARYDKSQKYFDHVLERIKNEGKLSSNDFERESDQKAGTWWDWKPTKMALEYLFWQGDLMVAERKGFQKYYDLTERVLPSDVNTTKPANDELAEYFVRKALSALGIANKREITRFMQPGRTTVSDLQVVDLKTMEKAIQQLLESREITAITIDDKKEINYALTEILESKRRRRKQNEKIFLLSPFDNFIIQRERLKRLFNFDYTIECYVPEPKRIYGYFVLPILWGSSVVGRLDPKADRKNSTLIINNLHFEENFAAHNEILAQLADKLVEFAGFNNCRKIEINKFTPENIRKPLAAEIKAAWK